MPFGWPLSWPSITLPSSLAFVGLPDARHWQRTLLRYLIKRTLGNYLDLPDRGVAENLERSTRIDADIANGSVKLRAVKLKTEVR